MIEIIPVKTEIFKPGMDLKDFIIRSLASLDLGLRERDILIISSKVVAISQDRIVDLTKERPLSNEIFARSGLDPRFLSVINREADEILGAVSGALLTLKNGLLLANAGADQSNCEGDNKVILLPDRSDIVSSELHAYLESQFACKIGVIIADSATRPLRRGTTGMAIAVAGFNPVIDDRGKKDLYGREMKVTTRALADNIVTAAQIVMGESSERAPIAIFRGLPEELFRNDQGVSEIIEPDKCLFFGNLSYTNFKTSKGGS
ncbi:MAG: coenzyme F420-0:L-glutamate ligase [Candidatus Hodarchaeales archaeon]